MEQEVDNIIPFECSESISLCNINEVVDVFIDPFVCIQLTSLKLYYCCKMTNEKEVFLQKILEYGKRSFKGDICENFVKKALKLGNNKIYK